MCIKAFIFLLTLLFGCSKPQKEISHNLTSSEKQGLEIFLRMSCNACHSIDGSLRLGPTIKNQYGTKIRHTDGSIFVINDIYIRESIIDPLKYIVEGYTPIMPSYKPILKEEEIQNLIAYIKSLR